ncbi:MAG: polysaccharide biosynthesis protein [Holosporaceae bacterium]|nr:polysaccharide biosynthesis protein [Holosporaceae bacterium]
MNFLLKKVAESAKKIKKLSAELIKKLTEKVDSIPENYVSHIKNIAVLILSYGTASFFTYHEFKFRVFLKETFSLLCVYCAIFFWFMDRIDGETPFRIAVGTTACVAPILFLNNPPMVALMSLLLIILLEFVLFEYMRGCNLFSPLIPVYAICERVKDAEKIEKLSDNKILELIVLSEQRDDRYSSLRTLDDLRSWLRRISYLPFYPTPRKLLYLGEKANHNNLIKLLALAEDYAIPLFLAKSTLDDSLAVAPASFNDIENVAVAPEDSAILAAALKNKRVWIGYDGRGCVLDLIREMSLANSINLTIFCETEKLTMEVELELARQCPDKNYKIKIADVNLLPIQGTKPDVFFYCAPVKSFYSGEDNLKEAVVKNVLDTRRLVDFAQSGKIPVVFILSSSRALCTNNSIGATLRLGELNAQFADSQSKKMHTKFKIIRIPEEARDMRGKTLPPYNGANLDLPEEDVADIYSRKEIITPLIKTISALLKNNDATSSVYTITPDDPKDATEPLEKTAIAHVMRTKFLSAKPALYEQTWTMKELNEMSPRELIAAVFQDLNEKINA